MAPLPQPKTPNDHFLRDIATSLRVLAGRDDDEPESGPTVLREPVEGVDATPTVHTSKGTRPTADTSPSEPPGTGAPQTSDDVDLDNMKRDQLDAYAEKVGVEDPKALPNKDAVKDAIRAKTSA